MIIIKNLTHKKEKLLLEALVVVFSQILPNNNNNAQIEILKKEDKIIVKIIK